MCPWLSGRAVAVHRPALWQHLKKLFYPHLGDLPTGRTLVVAELEKIRHRINDGKETQFRLSDVRGPIAGDTINFVDFAAPTKAARPNLPPLKQRDHLDFVIQILIHIPNSRYTAHLHAYSSTPAPAGQRAGSLRRAAAHHTSPALATSDASSRPPCRPDRTPVRSSR